MPRQFIPEVNGRLIGSMSKVKSDYNDSSPPLKKIYIYVPKCIIFSHAYPLKTHIICELSPIPSAFSMTSIFTFLSSFSHLKPIPGSVEIISLATERRRVEQLLAVWSR